MEIDEFIITFKIPILIFLVFYWLLVNIKLGDANRRLKDYKRMMIQNGLESLVSGEELMEKGMKRYYREKIGNFLYTIFSWLSLVVIIIGSGMFVYLFFTDSFFL